jgi:hypothetical protein
MELLDACLRLHPSGGWTGGMIRLIGSGADGKFQANPRRYSFIPQWRKEYARVSRSRILLRTSLLAKARSSILAGERLRESRCANFDCADFATV